MDIKKYFFIALTLLAIELLISLYMVLASQKSDPAGQTMGQGLGYLGLLIGGILTVILIICLRANIKWAVITIAILSALPLIIFLSFQLKNLFDQQLNRFSANQFEQGEGIFPRGKPTEQAKAIAANDTTNIRILVSQGVNLDQAGKDSSSYLHYAIQLACNYGHPLAPIKTLLEQGANPNFNGPILETFYAGGQESTQAMKMLLQKGADANQQDMYQVPILHSCTDIEKLKLLVEYGANINAVSSYWTSRGYTPVMSLVNNESWDLILFLLEKGANTEHKAADGTTLKDLLKTRRYAFESSSTPIPALFEKIEEKLGISTY